MKDTYDYLNEKCRIIYECYENQGFLKPKNKLENIAKSRYGFYFYILSMVTYQNDFDVLKLMITDTDFQNKFQSKSYQDYGVDAYFIDDENKTISLFNFKFKYYRENSEQQNSEINASKVFLSMVKESNDNGLEGNLKKAYKEIKKRNEELTSWTYNLYFVTTDERKVEEKTIQSFKSEYNYNLICLNLSELKKYIIQRPTPINCSFVLDKKSFFKYEIENKYKTIIAKIKVLELIRMFCENESYRYKEPLKDYSILQSFGLDNNVLFDNVRGFLGNTNYNESIERTIEKESELFFLYNNGITIITQELKEELINSTEIFKICLNDAQVVNGGQTLKILFEYFNKAENLNDLSKCYVLIRIFNVCNMKNCGEITSHIAEYTNSQNKISITDLKSLDHIQFKIEQELKEHNILYLRKRGTPKIKDNKKYNYIISLEKLAQIEYSILGFPQNASNKKNSIFTEHYNTVFGEEFKLFECYKHVEDFYIINKTIKGKKSQQIIFYILYISYKTNNKDYLKIYELLKKCLSEYKKENDLKESRKLIEEEFKKKLDQHLEESYKNQLVTN